MIINKNKKIDYSSKTKILLEFGCRHIIRAVKAYNLISIKSKTVLIDTCTKQKSLCATLNNEKSGILGK